jgi:flagellar biosynthesis protein FliR
MNVFVVGLPLQIMVGLVMLIITMPLFGVVMPHIFEQLPQQWDTVFREFAR